MSMAKVLKIGYIELRILKYLASNPWKHQQAIQEALNIKRYGSVVNAIKALHKKGFVQFKEGRNKRNKRIRLWKLSNKGKLFLSYWVEG